MSRNTKRTIDCFCNDEISDEETVLQPSGVQGQEKGHPGMQRRPSVKYGIDEFTDVTFLSESEDPKSVELTLQNRSRKKQLTKSSSH